MAVSVQAKKIGFLGWKKPYGGGNKEVFNLDFPIGCGKQNYYNWEMVLNSVKRFINEDSVFFCHSISCVFLAKYLIKNDLKVKRVVFVAGFNQYLNLDEDFDEVNCTMYTTRLSEFKSHATETYCYYSKTDPYVKFEKLKEFADLVEGKQICIGEAGHFNKAAGYTTFPELLKYI